MYIQEHTICSPQFIINNINVMCINMTHNNSGNPYIQYVSNCLYMCLHSSTGDNKPVFTLIQFKFQYHKS